MDRETQRGEGARPESLSSLMVELGQKPDLKNTSSDVLYVPFPSVL